MLPREQSDEAAIVEAREDAFYAAQTASDVPALDDLLSDELQFFGHTTGLVDAKATYLANVASGRYAHGPIVPVDRHIRVAGDGAVSTGMVDMVAKPRDADPYAMRLQQVLFWVKEHGEWRIRVRQATRMPL